MDGGGRSTVVMWLVAAALAVFAAMRLFGGGEGGAAAVRVEGAGAPAASRARRDRTPDLYVHVAGQVRRPGLIRVPPETRVASALKQAGGPTPRADLTAVNLAAKVQDGQQIVVPVRGAAPGAATDSPAAQLHLSTATVEQLDEVDGIGPTLAERIVEYRDAHGGFGSIDELARVEGIGEKRLATLRDALQP
ncbi:MAG TPA: ComEA family DNA-binding protein [Thermoleophilaceae bacterium]